MIVEYEVRFFVCIKEESIGLSCKTTKHFDKGVVAEQMYKAWCNGVCVGGVIYIPIIMFIIIIIIDNNKAELTDLSVVQSRVWTLNTKLSKPKGSYKEMSVR